MILCYYLNKFFHELKKRRFMIAFLFFILFIPKYVFAATGAGWGLDIGRFDGALVYYPNSTGTYTSPIGDTWNIAYEGVDWEEPGWNSPMIPVQILDKVGGNPFKVASAYSFLKDQLYYIDVKMCSDSTFSTLSNVYFGGFAEIEQNTTKAQYFTSTYANLNNYVFGPDSAVGPKYCREYVVAASPSKDSAAIGLLFNSINSKVYLLQFTITPGGYYSTTSNSSIKQSVDSLLTQEKQQSEKLYEIEQKQDETNQKIDEVKDTITDDTPPDMGSLDNSAGWLPPGPVDSIINLPLTLFQSILNALTTSCEPIHLTLPFVNYDFDLPCVSSLYSKISGLSLWMNTIGGIASAFILYNYFLKLYKWVDDTLSFRENNWQDWGGI